MLGNQALQLVEELQRELDELREQLAWSNRLGQLGTLAATLAHETNNLLTPIRSYAQLALANPADTRLAEKALQAAIDGTSKAGQLVERVMGLASPHTRDREPSCVASEVVDQAITSMTPVLQQHRIDTAVRVEPAGVAIDALGLEQVLINLITNACQAMANSTGHRQIDIESARQASRWALRVADTGPGIPEPIRDRLFEPFVTNQTHSREACQDPVSNGCSKPPPAAKGSGLGLSICRQILESAGGRIALDQSTERGCAFEIDLPLIAASAQ